MTPRRCRLDPVGEPYPPPPGEFMMLYAFGIGEVAISVSGYLPHRRTITHTIRMWERSSRALHDAAPGAVVGVRGPFGTDWELADAAGRDLVIVAGGVGLAPPASGGARGAGRPGALRQGHADRRRTARDDFLFCGELPSWLGATSSRCT